jgi:hypothetical protein
MPVPRAAPVLIMRSVIALLAFASFAGANAQAADPLATPECKAARAQLEATLDDPALGRSERAQRLAAVRKQASDACLGPASAQPARSGAPARVIAVPAPVIAAPPLYPRAASAPPRPLPPVEVPRPAVITSCDPGGCWDSEGRRLNQLGPSLMSPRGPCSVQGGVAVCP